VEADANSYSSMNGGPTVLVQCAGAWYAENPAQRHIDPTRDPNQPTGCYTWPYINGPAAADTHWDQVEVRIRKPVDLSFASIVGFHNPAYPFARSVTTLQPALLVTTNPGSTVLGYSNPGQTHTYIYSGLTRTTTDPDTTVTNVETISHISGGTGSVAFVKSSDCSSAPATATVAQGNAFSWSGSTSSISEFIDNGGLNIDGAKPHTYIHIWLVKKGVAGCEQYGPGATGGTITGPLAPFDWPIQPPAIPTVGNGCATTGTDTLNLGWPGSHPPGVYCWPAGKLTISAKDTDFIGYSFYAPQILVNSNGMHMTAATPAPGQPQVLFDAYGNDFTDNNGLDNCGPSMPHAPSDCAFAFSGNSDIINGQIFVPNGSISFSGAAANGSSGFMEAQKMFVSGNLAQYQGLGPGDGGTITNTTTTTYTVIPGGSHTTTDSNTVSVTTDPDTVVTGSTVPPSTFTATTGTNIGLGE
jgi:hypothetical protein